MSAARDITYIGHAARNDTSGLPQGCGTGGGGRGRWDVEGETAWEVHH